MKHGRNVKFKGLDWARRYGLLAVMAVFCLLVAFVEPSFITPRSGVILMRQIAINAVLAVGVTLVLLTGGVDLSLGSVVALAGVVAASCAHPGEYPMVVAVAAGIMAGMFCGGVNGLMVTWGRVAPFVVTLGMMAAARGGAYLLSGGTPVSNLDRGFTWLGSGSVLGIPVPVWVLGGVALVVHVVLGRTRLGRHLYATGGNERAATASGIRVNRVKAAAYMACGGLAGLAGVLLSARVTSGGPNAGVAYELDAIAAAVIGGTSLSGGAGGVGGTLLGALLIGLLSSGLDTLNVSPYYQQIVKGVIIVAAVWLDQQQRDRR
jgi:ribose/xylose/arabinose/galactoside ABC-type transport system permease subunit